MPTEKEFIQICFYNFEAFFIMIHDLELFDNNLVNDDFVFGENGCVSTFSSMARMPDCVSQVI